MKIIDAIWEKRNIGEACTEIEIEVSDSIEDINKAIKDALHNYIVVKVPSGLTDAAFTVQEQGCRYVETNIRLTKNLSEEPHLPGIYLRYEDAISYHKANESELKQVLDEIKSGEIFSTDKIACDPYFSKELSGRRYSLWAQDVIDSGKGKAYIVTYSGQSIGFVINVDKENYVDAFLAGLLSKARYSGLGLFIIWSIERIAFKEGQKKIITGVSSNNKAVVRLYMLFDYDIIELTANYIKHRLGV